MKSEACVEQEEIWACSKRSVFGRFSFTCLVALTALFFVSFSGSANAHSMHGTGMAENAQSSVGVAVPDSGLIIEQASDFQVEVCGLNCCSMSGCGYASLRLPQLFSPKSSTGLALVFNYLPWVKNPLDSLKRPPRFFA